MASQSSSIMSFDVEDAFDSSGPSSAPPASSPASSSAAQVTPFKFASPRFRKIEANDPPPNYSLWTAAKLGKYRDYITAHDPAKEDSPTWHHGFRMQHTGKKKAFYWICWRCFVDNKSIRDHVFSASCFRSVKSHLKRRHHWIEPDESETTTATSSNPLSANQPTIITLLGVEIDDPGQLALISRLREHFNHDQLALYILDWISANNLSFNIVSDERFKKMLCYGNPVVEKQRIPSRKKLSRMIDAEFLRAAPAVMELLAEARGLIHFTFDGWTSRITTSFLGIYVHFLDKKWKKHDILLELPPVLGRHTGEAQADYVVAAAEFFGIRASQFGYCVLDNATNNDTCVDKLAGHFGFISKERRLRCGPHSINRAVISMLYGNKSDNIQQLIDAFVDHEDEELQELEEALKELEDDDDIEDELAKASVDQDLEEEDKESTLGAEPYPVPTRITQKSLQGYRRGGPMGKLHNTGSCFRQSSQLVALLMKIQKELFPEVLPKRWVHNVLTRWLSDALMSERALELKPSLARLYIVVEEAWEAAGAKEDEKPAILSYKLTAMEWKVVAIFQQILEPFKIQTKQLQGRGGAGSGRSTTGGLDEYFPVFESLLDHIEDAIKGSITIPKADGSFEDVNIFKGLDKPTIKLLKIYLKLGWVKLHKYYEKMTSPAYAIAILMNPSKKWRILDTLWSRIPGRKSKGWKAYFTAEVRRIWERDYRDMSLPEVVDTEKSTPDYSGNYFERVARHKRDRDGLAEDVVDGDSQASQPTSKRRRGPRSAAPVITAAVEDELDRYLSSPVVTSPNFVHDPVGWWREIGQYQYPRVSYMATDYLTIPSSTGEAERGFNSTGAMVSPKRNRLDGVRVGKTQCLRDWSRKGIYTPGFDLSEGLKELFLAIK